METKLPAIQNSQFSNFLLAINHIPAKKMPVVKVSKNGVIFLKSVKFPAVKLVTA
jgi:hypothetical protein